MLHCPGQVHSMRDKRVLLPLPTPQHFVCILTICKLHAEGSSDTPTHGTMNYTLCNWPARYVNSHWCHGGRHGFLMTGALPNMGAALNCRCAQATGGKTHWWLYVAIKWARDLG